ncbi:MAG: DUF6159 family protein, partial [Candidatus Promineifilaceae bacterium]
MFTRISNSWQLVRASWTVLRADKELVIFPIVSGIAAIIVLITFAVPMFLTGLFDAMFAGEFGPARLASYAMVFLFYLVQYFVILFANTALVGAAMIRLEGGDPTVSDGFRIAWEHVGAVFGYAMISATVGLILRWLSERGALGRIASSLIGMAWNLATFLVIPVLVVENVGPVEGVKRSGRMLKDTWGEQIAGNFSIGLIFFLLIMITIIAGAFVTIALASLTQTIVLIALSIIVFVAAVVILVLLNSTLSG